MAMTVAYTNFGGMLVYENRSGQERQTVADPVGSLVGELDSNQALTYSAEYWPFGEIQSESGANTSEWSFMGLLGYLQDLTVLLYVRARYYLVGRAAWLTCDPLWPAQSAYHYALLNPIRFGDPSGMQVIRNPLQDYFKGWGQECQKGMESAFKAIADLAPCVPPLSMNQAVDCFFEALAKADTSGVATKFVRFEYGACCGLKKRCFDGDPRAIDCIDIACATHDSCLKGPSEYVDPKKQCACNAALCRKIKKCGCKRSPNPEQCEKARGEMIRFYCYVVPTLLKCLN